MSVSFYAKAVIGLAISPSRLKGELTKVKAFEHNYPDAFEFDPMTGEELWRLVRGAIPGYDEDRECLGKYPVLFSTDNKSCVVALHKAECSDWQGDHLSSVSLPSQSSIDQFKDDMIKLGLWDDRSFGLHCVMRVSY